MNKIKRTNRQNNTFHTIIKQTSNQHMQWLGPSLKHTTPKAPPHHGLLKRNIPYRQKICLPPISIPDSRLVHSLPSTGTSEVSSKISKTFARHYFAWRILARFRGSSLYPLGFMLCHLQVSTHMSFRLRFAVHPNSRFANVGSAYILSISPARRGMICFSGRTSNAANQSTKAPRHATVYNIMDFVTRQRQFFLKGVSLLRPYSPCMESPCRKPLPCPWQRPVPSDHSQYRG